MTTTHIPRRRLHGDERGADLQVHVRDGPTRTAPERGAALFVDGGLWANNPVLVGLIDALDMTEPGQEIQIFCLGTCPMPQGNASRPAHSTADSVSGSSGGKAAELSIDAQQFAYDHMAMKIARHVGRPCTIVRFPSQESPGDAAPVPRP